MDDIWSNITLNFGTLLHTSTMHTLKLSTIFHALAASPASCTNSNGREASAPTWTNSKRGEIGSTQKRTHNRCGRWMSRVWDDAANTNRAVLAVCAGVRRRAIVYAVERANIHKHTHTHAVAAQTPADFWSARGLPATQWCVCVCVSFLLLSVCIIEMGLF